MRSKRRGKENPQRIEIAREGGRGRGRKTGAFYHQLVLPNKAAQVKSTWLQEHQQQPNTTIARTSAGISEKEPPKSLHCFSVSQQVDTAMKGQGLGSDARAGRLQASYHIRNGKCGALQSIDPGVFSGLVWAEKAPSSFFFFFFRRPVFPLGAMGFITGPRWTLYGIQLG